MMKINPDMKFFFFVVVYGFLVLHFDNSTGFIHYAFLMVMFTDTFYMKG